MREARFPMVEVPPGAVKLTALPYVLDRLEIGSNVIVAGFPEFAPVPR